MTLLLLMLVSACSQDRGAGIDLQLENASAGPVSEVQVAWNDRLFTCGDLAPGQACKTTLVPSAESALSVIYLRQGKKIVRPVDVYIGRGLGGELTITLKDYDEVVWHDAIRVPN
ncbi:MAG: hypothetical protein U0807_18275 [Candidatus Binatia bacterium]